MTSDGLVGIFVYQKECGRDLVKRYKKQRTKDKTGKDKWLQMIGDMIDKWSQIYQSNGASIILSGTEQALVPVLFMGSIESCSLVSFLKFISSFSKSPKYSLRTSKLKTKWEDKQTDENTQCGTFTLLQTFSLYFS